MRLYNCLLLLLCPLAATLHTYNSNLIPNSFAPRQPATILSAYPDSFKPDFIIDSPVIISPEADSQIRGSQQVAEKDSIRPLNIGDTIPQEVLNYVINRIPAMSGNDLNNRLIVLDFWNWGCGICIAGFKKMQHLQNEFKDRLQVLLVSKDKDSTVRSFWNSQRGEKFTAGISLPVISGDTLLSQYFKHLYVPHLVWVKNGIVKGFTSGVEATSSNVDLLLNDKELSWRTKQDALSFNKRIPLLGFMNKTVLTYPTPIFYSAITGEISGTISQSGIQTDSLNRTVRFYRINGTVADLYAIATQRTDIFTHREGRLIINLKSIDPARLYCYEAVWPQGTNISKIKAKMLQDLDRFLGIHSSLEKRVLPNVGEQDVFIISEIESL